MFFQLNSRCNSTFNPYFLNRLISYATTIGAQSVSGVKPKRSGFGLVIIRKYFDFILFIDFKGSSAEKQQPDHHQHREHERKRKFEDITEKGWCMRLLLVGDCFDHEIGTIANISVRPEKD